MTGYVYDSGALIAAERRDERMWGIHRRALALGSEPLVPATVLAQVRRRPAPLLDRLLSGCAVVDLDRRAAELVGHLLGIGQRDDVVDAHVVLCALGLGATCVTSDRSDIEHLAGLARADWRRRFGRTRLAILSI